MNIVFAETLALIRGRILNTNISPVGGDILILYKKVKKKKIPTERLVTKLKALDPSPLGPTHLLISKGAPSFKEIG